MEHAQLVLGAVAFLASTLGTVAFIGRRFGAIEAQVAALQLSVTELRQEFAATRKDSRR